MTRHLRLLRTAFLLALCLPLLAGCFGAAAVGVSAGVLMFSDRRNAETYVADEGIEIRVANRIREKYGDTAHINATSFNRAVLLTGEAPSQEAKAEIEKLTASVPNVRAITNEIQVAQPSTFSARSNDTYLTSKVKARFIDYNRFSPNHVKVVSEAGAVYLLGMVTQPEADNAVEIARTTGGVQKVVRVFEIISAEQARQLDNRPAESVGAEKKVEPVGGPDASK
jgi:osmotically-inducible protein OsmY